MYTSIFLRDFAFFFRCGLVLVILFDTWSLAFLRQNRWKETFTLILLLVLLRQELKSCLLLEHQVALLSFLSSHYMRTFYQLVSSYWQKNKTTLFAIINLVAHGPIYTVFIRLSAAVSGLSKCLAAAPLCLLEATRHFVLSWCEDKICAEIVVHQMSIVLNGLNRKNSSRSFVRNIFFVFFYFIVD